MARVFIAGYYGFGNLGDEAILAGILGRLRTAVLDLQVVVTHGGWGPPQAEPVRWDDLPALVEAVRAADLVVLGGGGIFFDYWEFDPESVLTRGSGGVSYYATFPLLATLLGKPLFIWGVGVGPFRSEAARRLTRLSFLQADAATVRDEESAALLRELGVPADRFALSADPAFGLELAPPEAADRILAAEGVPADRPLVGVVVREWDVGVDPRGWAAEAAAALDRFAGTHDVTLVFIPFQRLQHRLVNDARAAWRVVNLLTRPERVAVIGGQYGPAEVAGLLGRCELVVGMRLHAVILAAAAGTPTVPLVYDPKVRAAARQLGLGAYAVDLAGLRRDDLLGRLEAAWAARRELTEAVRARVEVLRAAAAADGVRAAELLGRKLRKSGHPEVEAWLREVFVGHSLRLWRTEGDVLELRMRAAALENRLAEQENVVKALSAELARSKAERAVLAGRLAELESRIRWKRYRVADRLVAVLWYSRHPRKAAQRVGNLIAARWRSVVRNLVGGEVLRRVLEPWGPFRDGYVVEDNSQVVVFSTDPGLFAEYAPRAELRSPGASPSVKVTLVAPAKNEADSLERWWQGILMQTRLPDEIIVVETGSADGTGERLRELAAKSPVPFRVIEAPGANIAAARNIAIRAARYDVIACIDLGCRPRRDWLEKLIAPFELEASVQVVAGWVEPVRADGLPMRWRRLWPWASLERIRPESFLPPGASAAYRKEVWEAVGGYPEWLTLTGEDTYFALELKRQGGTWAFVPEAVVEWEAPDSVGGYVRKMFRWAVGDGESGVHAEYYWRWAVGLGVFAGLTLVLLLALGAGLGLGVIDPLWAVLPVLGWLGAAARLRDPAILAGRAAAVAGFLAGVRRRPLVEARRWAQLRGVWFILSGVPIDDTGGGARATQVALELLRQGCFVVFISKFPRYESVDLGLRFAHPNLRTYRAADFDWDRFVGQYKALLEGKPLVALVEFPVADFLPIVDRVRGAGGRVIYDLIDDWATSLGGNWYRPEVERAFIDRADVLTATAPALADRLRELSGREVQLVPNAVNSRLFDPSRPYPRPEDMPGAEWVMIYAGALWGEWFDWELVIRLADAYPEAAVLVIGDYRGQCPERRPNLHFLGLKPQRELPAYLAHSDVAIIPWKVNKITLATSPLKVYEYLAMRRPVVAPDLPPLRGIPGVWLASCKDEFVHLVKYVRDVDYPVDQVTDFVQANNWEARVKVLSSLVGGT